MSTKFELATNSYLQNAAATVDGVELRFEGNKCGKSYRIKQESIASALYWQAFFYDWHDGWTRLTPWPGAVERHLAVERCNKHAVEHRLIKFVPNRPKFKATWGGLGMAAAQAAGVAGLSL